MDLLQCAVCLEVASSPKLCPKCSKFSCRICLDRTYELTPRRCCPHCQSDVRLKEYVTVSWAEELQGTLAQMQGKLATSVQANTSICPTHAPKRLSSHCWDCKMSLCFICWKTHDKNHNVVPIELAYEVSLEKVKNFSNQAKFNLDRCSDFQTKNSATVNAVSQQRESVLTSIRRNCQTIEQDAKKHLEIQSQAYEGPHKAIKSSLSSLNDYLKNIADIETNQLMDKCIEGSQHLIKPPEVDTLILAAENAQVPNYMQSLHDVIPPFDIDQVFILTKNEFSLLNHANSEICFKKITIREITWSICMRIETVNINNNDHEIARLYLSMDGTKTLKDYELHIGTSKEPLLFARSHTMKIPEVFRDQKLVLPMEIDMEMLKRTFTSQSTAKFSFYFRLRPRTYKQKCLDLERYVETLLNPKRAGFLTDVTSTSSPVASRTNSESRLVSPSELTGNRIVGRIVVVDTNSLPPAKRQKKEHNWIRNGLSVMIRDTGLIGVVVCVYKPLHFTAKFSIPTHARICIDTDGTEKVVPSERLLPIRPSAGDHGMIISGGVNEFQIGVVSVIEDGMEVRFPNGEVTSLSVENLCKFTQKPLLVE